MSAAKRVRSVKLRQAVEFEVTLVPFVPFQALRTLDVERLARARRAVVELGQFESDRCKRTVRAVIKAGQVTEVKVDSCKKAKTKMTPEFARLITRARALLKRSTPPAPKLPVSVARFFARNTLGDIELNVESICMTVCVDFYDGTRFCSTCCEFVRGGKPQFGCATIFQPF